MAGPRRIRLLWSALALVASLAPGTVPASGCDAAMRQIKLDVFDQHWKDVKSASEDLLAQYPGCRHRQLASYLRAQALQRMGQPGPAFSAYIRFLDQYCEASQKVLNCDLARVSLYDLAGHLFGTTGQRQYLDILVEGLEQPGDAGIFAALTLADLEDPALQNQAMPHLLAAYDTDIDDDVRNRICLAVLKIDPARMPCGKSQPEAGGTAAPSLISVEIFNKESQRVELRLNMPVALADSVVKALPAVVHREMAREGIDLQQIFQAVRDQARGTIFEADTEETSIRIWLQ